MTFKELKSQAVNRYYPALFIEQIVPRRVRIWTTRILTAIMLVLLGASIILYLFSYFSLGTASLNSVSRHVYGIFFIYLSGWMIVFALEAFYNSYYFQNSKISFELANILHHSNEEDALRDFLLSFYGKMIMARLGIFKNDIRAYLDSEKNSRHSVTKTALTIQTENVSDYVASLFDSSKTFQQFLLEHSLQKKDFIAATLWVIDREVAYREHAQWWTRARLGRIPGIGKNWSYGQLYLLTKYSEPIPEASADHPLVHDSYGEEELKEIENILTKQQEANVLLVGDDHAAKINIIARLNAMINTGTALPEIEHKRIVILDASQLVAGMKTKGAFEAEFIKMMNETVHAGNVILVIPDMAAFMSSAETIGSNITSLLDPYFASRDLQIIGLADLGQYRAALEKNTTINQRFEKIIMKEIDEQNTIKVLENETIFVENRTNLFFTYPALAAIAESANRYFSEGMMPDKAVDLMLEIAPTIHSKGVRVVGRNDVLDLIKKKTGIPVGEIKGEEKVRLANLEEVLHKRIVGQDIAISTISNAVRRARSGINNPNRPLGSFLFLGPTGVGKTETTKALAEVFFNSDSKINRLDMSEYAGTEALSKLIGSFEGGKSGVLVDMIREHQYGVLLLDEFEKTTPTVMNLFLQILDEGMFSDMTGKKVSARNLLIIATSNAGSDMLWEAAKRGDDLSAAKDSIVDSIIKAQIFKPELLNRFDGVILFHPLGSEHLDKIARLELAKLAKRLTERGMNLVVNDDLVKYVVKYGTDPKFGARAMNRAIQDNVEQVIANKIVKGDIKPGSEIILSASELK